MKSTKHRMKCHDTCLPCLSNITIITYPLKSNRLCLCQDTEIPTGCLGDKYRIAFYRDCRPVRTSSLLLHCY